MERCKHVDSEECGSSCECICEGCQLFYEDMWGKFTKQFHLCDSCGMPETVTLASLEEYREWHFYQPCESCKPAYLAFMAEKRLCATCQDPLLPYGICKGCHCTQVVETCECRQCEAKRASDST